MTPNLVPLTVADLQAPGATLFRYVGGLVFLVAGVWDLLHGGSNPTLDYALIGGGAATLGVSFTHP